MGTLREYRDRPHWSFSALNQFVNICSLQYAFQRVMRLPPAFTPASLSFGSAFHRCAELISLARRDGTVPSPAEASDLFGTVWERQLREDPDVRFEEGEDANMLGCQGREATACLARHMEPAERVLTVSEAFAVPLVDRDGTVLETPMIGEIDAVVERDGQRSLVDWKTAARRWARDKARLDLQPTVFLYGYSLQHGQLPGFRFDVVVKNKTPVLERHPTTRGPDDFERMVRLVRMVESMIAAEHWLPSEQSFYCAGCPYREACRAWHRESGKVSVRMAA